MAAAADHLYSKIPLAIARGRVLIRQRPSDAIAPLEATVATCREKKFAGQIMRALTILGQAYGLVGRPAEGIPLLKEAIALQEQAGAFVDRALWTRVLAGLYLRAGDLDNAEATANTALRFAERYAERGNEAWIHWLVGEVLCERGDYAAAEQRFQAARMLAAELQMRPLIAHCHFSFGKLHKRTGKHQQAKEQLSAATARYREMDMRFWLEQAEAELARLA